MLATPTCAFVHDVSSGLVSLVWHLVNIEFVRLACPRLATPTRAFVYDVSLALTNLAWQLINTVFFPVHHYLDNTAPKTTTALPCACGAMATNSTSTTPSWHRPCHPSHGYLKHGYTILRSRLDWHRHKGTTWWSNLIGFTPATSSAMHRSLRLGRGDGVHRLTLGFFSCLTVCVATFVTVEGCWVLWLLENIGYIRICSNLSYTPSWSCTPINTSTGLKRYNNRTHLILSTFLSILSTIYTQKRSLGLNVCG